MDVRCACVSCLYSGRVSTKLYCIYHLSGSVTFNFGEKQQATLADWIKEFHLCFYKDSTCKTRLVCLLCIRNLFLFFWKLGRDYVFYLL